MVIQRVAMLFALGGMLLADLRAGEEPRNAVVQVAPRAGATRVPDALRQGTFLPPQAVSAVNVSEDGRSIAVSTLAFRHDRNFWLLSSGGEPLRGRHVAPWAPFQIASVPGALAVGLAYSRVTGPQPVISIFIGEKEDETEIVDSLGTLGWIRYGAGDWRTGWTASLIGDLVARAGGSIVTVRGHDGAIRVDHDGRREKYPFPHVRPYRLVASGDERALVSGFIVLEPGAPVPEEVDLPWSRSFLTVSDASSGKERWAFAPPSGAPRPPRPPDPLRDFPEFAEGFGLATVPQLPCRVAVSVAANADASKVALADHGGWISIRKGAVIGKWDPPYRAIPFVPRGRGTLRVIAEPGRESARADFPEEGLFELRADSSWSNVWCFPLSWFARGMAGSAWLPADPEARSVHLFDVPGGAWQRSWEFPDAIADLALHPDGSRAWVSCWDGNLYLLHRDGRAPARVEVSSPARLTWSPDGSFAVAGTESGHVVRLDGGAAAWRTRLPVAEPRPLEGPLAPVFEGLPIYAVGRVGPEHAYVGDMWLVKAGAGGFLVDAGGTSAIPFTLQKIRAAGVDPAAVRHLLHTHSHGDHAGGAYLWRAMGLRIVAPQTAALATTWPCRPSATTACGRRGRSTCPYP